MNYTQVAAALTLAIPLAANALTVDGKEWRQVVDTVECATARWEISPLLDGLGPQSTISELFSTISFFLKAYSSLHLIAAGVNFIRITLAQ